MKNVETVVMYDVVASKHQPFLIGYATSITQSCIALI